MLIPVRIIELLMLLLGAHLSEARLAVMALIARVRKLHDLKEYCQPGDLE